MISQLQLSKDISGGADNVVSVLQEQVRSQQDKIAELADDVDRYRRNLKEKEAILDAREKVIITLICWPSGNMANTLYDRYVLCGVFAW